MGEAATEREAREIEQDAIWDMQEKYRLNDRCKTLISRGVRERVRDMVHGGTKYKDVAEAVGISIGTVSKIKYRMIAEGTW